MAEYILETWAIGVDGKDTYQNFWAANSDASKTSKVFWKRLWRVPGMQKLKDRTGFKLPVTGAINQKRILRYQVAASTLPQTSLQYSSGGALDFTSGYSLARYSDGWVYQGTRAPALWARSMPSANSRQYTAACHAVKDVEISWGATVDFDMVVIDAEISPARPQSALTAYPINGTISVPMLVHEIITYDLATTPDAPSAPTLSGSTATSINLAWNAPSSDGGLAINGYDYYYSTSSTAPTTATTPSGATAAGTRSATLSGLALNTNVYVWVRAKNEMGNSAWSAALVTKPATVTAPAAPAAPTAGTKTTSSIVVNWTAPSNGGAAISGYDYYYSTSSTAPTTATTPSGSTTNLTTTLTSLAVDTDIYVYVRAKNTVGAGPWSTALRTNPTQSTVPTPPEAPVVQNKQSYQLTVAWNAPSNGGLAITGYDYYYSTSSTAPTSSTTPSGSTTATSLTLDNLWQGMTYYIWVRAKNSKGASGWSKGLDTSTSASQFPWGTRMIVPAQSSAKRLIITNTADVETWPEIIATGPMRTLKLSADNGFLLELPGGLAANEELHVVTNPRNRSYRINGNPAVARINRASKIVPFKPGSHGLYAQAPGADFGAEVRVIWRNQYRSLY